MMRAGGNKKVGSARENSGPVASSPGKRTLTEGLRVGVQQRPAPSGAAAQATQAAATRGIAGASHPLPHIDLLQPLFGGHDLGSIRAHTDAGAIAGARDMGAAAFATGDHVAFASPPDLHTAAHEAAHVVQQRDGVSLPGGVGQSGDAHEQNANAVADRVVQGLPAGALLPSPERAANGTGAPEGGVQRQGGGTEMTPEQVERALTWAQTSDLGVEAIQEVQRFCGMPADQIDGVYSETTARAVFRTEQEHRWPADGKADPEFFYGAGLIMTNEIVNATISDEMLATVEQRFPDGVTIAIYADYNDHSANNQEFVNQASGFAQNEGAVGLVDGAIQLGAPCPIREIGDVIEAVQSIHRGLLERWTAAQAEGGDRAAAAPAYTRVLNLALFSHGETWGMELHEDEYITGGGLHAEDPIFGRPSNIAAFVRGLSDAVMPGVRVELFGCSAGRGNGTDGKLRGEYSEWAYEAPPAEGDVAGLGSFASALAEGLGEDATVLAHATAGHTTENYAARVFGAEGAGAGGLPYFQIMYPESYVQSELERLPELLPDLDVSALDDVQRAALHDELRAEMWDHFRDSIDEEQHRLTRGEPRRYAERTGNEEFEMGQEMFLHPERARELLHADWEEYWLPNHLDEIALP